VRLLGRDLIEMFVREHADSEASLRRWAQVIETNTFRRFGDVRKTFASAGYVRPSTVFNIAGNKYRLISLVDFSLRTAKVEAILTHQECDAQGWRAR
jgi:mRNA interferase HigB